MSARILCVGRQLYGVRRFPHLAYRLADLPRQNLSADDVAVVDAAPDERLEGAGYAQVLRQLLQRRPRVLPDELVRVGRAREQDLRC